MTELTRFIAQILGPVYLAFGISVLIQHDRFKRMMSGLKTDDLSMYVSGMGALAIGITIILKHSIWTSLPTGLVSLFGWAIAIKGAWILISPEGAIAMGKKVKDSWQPIAFALLVLGAYMTWVGYLMQ